jgi:hypothetical protein
MDVLPLYIVLLGTFTPALWLLLRAPNLALASSAAIYALMWQFDLNLPAYPSGTWAFNPFAWQLLFVFGAWCALGGAKRLTEWTHSPFVRGLAIAYLLFALYIALGWYIPRLGNTVPTVVAAWIYPIDKANLDVLRIAHFISLAIITVWLVPRDRPFLKSHIAKPAIICGQHSLETFCLGVFLSFAGHFVFTALSDKLVVQILVSVAGIAIMVGVAYLLSWYKRVERRGSGPRPPAAKPGVAGSGA